MAPDAPLRFRSSWAYQATHYSAVLSAVLLAGVALGGGGSIGPNFVLCVLVAVVWTVIGRLSDRTTITPTAIRGASSVGGLWSTRAPGLSSVERIYTSTRGLSRLVVIEATDVDGETMQWRLDAPRTLRWGRDADFEADVERLERAWIAVRRSVSA
jgi:hypothetical protein